jgi:hypothetical protein
MRAHTQNITSHLPYFSPHQPWLSTLRYLLAHLSILYSVFKSLQLLSAAVAPRLALQIQIALIPQLVASHQHLNEIPDTLGAGVGVGAGVPAEAFAGVNQRWQHPN